jgi:hypothetical protein
LYGIDLLVFHNEILTLSDLEPARCVLSRDDVTGFGIDVLLLQAVAGFPIDPVETDLFDAG